LGVFNLNKTFSPKGKFSSLGWGGRAGKERARGTLPLGVRKGKKVWGEPLGKIFGGLQKRGLPLGGP